MPTKMSNPHDPYTKRLAFRELLARPGCTVMPGGFSPLYARMCEDIGFETFFVAGSQMSAFLLGVPDNGIIGLRDVVDHARHVAARTTIPIFVDADTGFGNAVNVHYTVQELVRAGVAGMQLEDQEAPKKSGTLAGRRCIPIDEAVGKIRAAVEARNELDPAFVICARCDDLGAEGGTWETTLERCIAYVRDGGADLVWLNSSQTREQLRIVARDVPGPVLTIWGGTVEAAPTIEEYSELGVRFALYPTLPASSGLQGAWELLNDFHERGTAALADYAARANASKWGRADFKKLNGNKRIADIEKHLPASQQRDYDSTWGHEPFSEKK
jgi:2-methylisocitrate lyase-like PEP mutase family enzyme